MGYAGLLFAEEAPREPSVPGLLTEAIGWLETPPPKLQQYDYVMTGKLRLLFFWVGKDDVGGGYVRVGESRDGSEEVVELKMGSDPEKAPRRINRWGAATEVRLHPRGERARAVGAFFGFMKASRNESREDAEAELGEEKEKRRFLFQASVNRLEPGATVSGFLPFHSGRDFNLHELGEAQAMVLDELVHSFGDMETRRLDEAARRCAQTEGFLFALKDSLDAALAGREAPFTTCYSHNARPYELVVREAKLEKDLEASFERHDGERVEHRYEDVLEAKVQARPVAGDGGSSFRIWVGRSGALRGIPLRVDYQPNWWFRVILNLDADKDPAALVD